MSTKHFALPKPKISTKFVGWALLALILALIIHDPVGSAQAVRHTFDALGIFAEHSGGGR